METKKWYDSLGVWGGAVVVGATIAGFFGYQIDEAAQAQIVDAIVAGVTAIGGLLAIIGRVKANKQIK